MKLFEFEAKKFFGDAGIKVPKGYVVDDKKQAREAYSKIGVKEVVVKAQVLVGGRGKAGGIKFAQSAEELEKVVGEMLSSKIKGESVKKVLIEEKLPIKKELYLGITWDRSNRAPVVIASSQGGMDIEEVAKSNPKAIAKVLVEQELGFEPFIGRELAFSIGLSGQLCQEFGQICFKLYKLFENFDAELIEINPLVITNDNTLVAADARLNISDDALFRHVELNQLSEERLGELTPLEAKARKLGVQYVELDGSIGVIGNGAGLTMSTLDVVKYYGGAPANFLDAGGGSSEREFVQALEILNQNPKVKLIFVNILAGITRCDEVAKAIVKAKDELGVKKPFVIRLAGTNEKEGRAILEQAGLNAFSDMEEAAKHAVELVKKLG
ncbi:succinate--CoA ligase subunit beta [Candidatus Marsarchaeota G2 archaeon ECH_B_SAG-F08]|jgi:succinyl-CoA synthetase beta subunit|uniref:Succinate--CoA ligase [ADP-forming] subunit beta n=3 Tax=Candidatus Marsarchaeota TaxID=1978152 RepID=A0A2R6BYJ9_9ARCH|nr:MAG: succinate--CoA ligase subunit beta [Candidatus Marsarchaeota G1 archaeon BE_D]PSN98121.1 MAG: succinate--CoA ligase subunit beta [Candidatus Marsarchaeota G2 archaeon ECH_B_SAG-F08]PSO03720.1 MAG: succinate--CoA ligase subunit beta [Candidatus Marsarchaeota G2 archaeon ECH_B_SAG-G06]